MSLPNNKKIVIIGGGTNTYISNHLSLAAPAYGQTAKKLYEKFSNHLDNKMQTEIILTRMADPSKLTNSTSPDTPEDIEAIVDNLVADPDTRVIIFNVAMVDFKPKAVFDLFNYEDSALNMTEFGKYKARIESRAIKGKAFIQITPYQKIINKIRRERKDILLVGFKTTCGATKEEQFHKGLKLCKDASANIVFVNDVDKNRINLLNNIEDVINKLVDKLQNHFSYSSEIFEENILNNKLRITNEFNYRYSDNVIEYKKQLKDLLLSILQNNGLVTPEESSYWYNTRDEALDSLVQMVVDRSHLHFTRSTVIDSETISWDSEEIPNVLRDVVNHCVAQGAYKTFTIGDSIGTKGSVGHFAYKVNETTFLTSKRKSNFNELDKIGLVKVVTDGPDHIYAYGAKPSVGGQSQRIIFDMYPHLDCILHFHSPLRQEYRNEFSIKSQFEVECGSHECGQNTAQGLNEYVLDNGQKVYAVHLDHHGPNIVFSKETDSNSLIRFVEKYFDMSKKTTGLSAELI